MRRWRLRRAGVTFTLTGNEAGPVLVQGGAQIATFCDTGPVTLSDAHDSFTGSGTITAAVTVNGGARHDGLGGAHDSVEVALRTMDAVMRDE